MQKQWEMLSKNCTDMKCWRWWWLFGLKRRYDETEVVCFPYLVLWSIPKLQSCVSSELYFFSLLFPFHFPRSFIASSPAPLSGYGKKLLSSQSSTTSQAEKRQVSSQASFGGGRKEGKFGGRKGSRSKQYQTVIKKIQTGYQRRCYLKKYFTKERSAAFQEQKSHFPPQFVGDCKSGNTSQVKFWTPIGVMK